MTTLAELVTPKTFDEERAALLAEMKRRGLPATDWHPGSVPRTLMDAQAAGLAGLSGTIAEVAKGGSLDDATGAWLTLLARQRYNVERKLATRCERPLRLAAVPGSGPHTIAAGQLWASTVSGRRYANTEGGTLEPGGTLDLLFRAEEAGSAYNVATSAIELLLTPIAGVSIATGADLPIASPGTDDEDDEALRQRCRDQLPSLGPGATASAYRNWALATADIVTRVRVSGDGGTGGVTVLIAGPAGGIDDPEVVDAVQAFIDERAPLTDAASVASAEAAEIAAAVTLYGPAAAEAAARAAALEAYTELVHGVDIGGTLYRAEIIEALMGPAGVRNAVITSLTVDEVPEPGDIDLGPAEVAAAGALAITWVSI